MPWNPNTTMELKEEFVHLAIQPNTNISELCRRFGISRPTAYKWLARYEAHGQKGLVERSRRPAHQPNQTPPEVEQLVVKLRGKQRAWGARKLRAHLRRQAQQGEVAVEAAQIPSASTITRILQRHDLLGQPEAPSRQGPWQRFEYERPNQLWQMDFKGEFRLGNGRWCYPLTILDDHSRFSPLVGGCANTKRQGVRGRLISVFRRYGLPQAILCDNGPPWGSPKRFADGSPHYTKLAAWLMRLGIEVKYSSPAHPQTHGKNERFNGTLQAEVLAYHQFQDLGHANEHLEQWRQHYNTQRPHQALDMEVPVRRYRPSNRPYPQRLPPVEYGPDDIVRKVSAKGIISVANKSFRVGKAFDGFPVALRARPSSQSHTYGVYYCNHHIRTIKLTKKLKS